MHIPLRERLRHLWKSLQRWRARAVLEKRKEDHGGHDQNAARSRFWTELREGQREAEARSGGSRS